MKILQLGKAQPPIKGLGGVEKVMQKYYYNLNKFNIRCDVLGSNDKFKYEEDNYVGKGLIFRTKLLTHINSTFISFQLIKKLIKINKNYDIIHVHHPDPMSFLALFFINFKGKIIIHWHSDIIRQKVIYMFYKYLESHILNKADLILCTSPHYYRDNSVLKNHLDKTRYLPIGLNLESLSIDESLLKVLTESETGLFKIIFIGRLVGYKGLKHLIEALSYLDERFILNVIGDGPLLNKLQLLTNDLSLTGRVNFLGNLNNNQKNAYLRYSDVLVLPSVSRNEAYGIVQIEAMAFGLPVISTRIIGSGVDWVNENGVTGYVVPIKDANSLSQALLKLSSDEHSYIELSTNCLKRFSERFDDNIITPKLIKIYRKLLKNNVDDSE